MIFSKTAYLQLRYIILKSIIQQGWGVLKIRSDAKDFGLSPKAGEKDAALRVGENSA